MSVTITTEGGRVRLASPYHPALPSQARASGGRFDAASKTWTFDARDEQRVRELARSIYGTDGTDTGQTVSVQVDLDKRYGWYQEPTLFGFGRELAYRPGRDSAVRLGDGVVVIAGGFPDSGGSVKNPRLAWEDGTVLEVRDVPAALAEQDRDGVTVVEQRSDTAALTAERERLLARVAEIDSLLAEAQ